MKKASKQDGQPRRRLDASKARNEFGFEATTDLREGLKKTIARAIGTERGIPRWKMKRDKGIGLSNTACV